MRTLSWWAIASGVVFAALSFLVLPYLRWNMARMLSEVGGETMLPNVMEITSDEYRVPLVVTRIHSGLSVMAGILMLQRRRAGWFLWASLCLLVIVASIFDIARGAVATAPALRGIGWACVLWISWNTVRKKPELYWTKGAARVAR